MFISIFLIPGLIVWLFGIYDVTSVFLVFKRKVLRKRMKNFENLYTENLKKINGEKAE